MGLTFGLLISAFIYIMITAFLFYSKEKQTNIDTEIFSKMVVGAILSIIAECSLYFLNTVVLQKVGDGAIFLFMSKVFVCVVIFWFMLMTVYSIAVATNGQINKIRMQKLFNILVCGISILILILPVEFISMGNGGYTSGPATTMGFMAIIICCVIIFGCIFKARKNLKNKKYIPLIILIVAMTTATVIQAIHPELLLFNPVIAMVTVVMYHTIENPDIKIIEQLEVAKEQADKANRAKTDFLSSMSHEIRTPLNAIMGFSDCINNSTTLEEAKENAQDIINASSTLLEIVNGILDISKIEAGKLEIINSAYNAKSTFEELAKLITPKMYEKGLDFSYYIAPDLPQILYGDHANIRKIVTNLLSNAAKYTEKGYVRYEVNCVNTQDVSKLIITVEDSGRGIKQENLDKLFTKFQRLDEDKNTTIEGTGLGLAITKQLTELMGGKIIVHTVYGEGSKFTVVLNQPIEKTEIKATSKETQKTTLDLQGVKILIVDDNSLNLKVAAKLLERYNADSITCSESGFNCIEKITSGEKYDVILLDDMMPKMSGVETLKKLKENANFKIPVIALTANAITGMKEKYLSEGFDDYLAKPIEKEELIKVMNNIFNSKEKAKEIESLIEETEELPQIKQQEEEQIIPVEEDIEEVLSVTQKITPIAKETFQFQEPASEKIDNVLEKKASALEEKKKYLTQKGIDLDKALSLLGDMEMYESTLKDFSDNADNKWLNIRHYKQSSDLANYAIEVHSLKSDAKYLGFMRLAEIAYEHELKSKDNDENFIKNHFEQLEAEYNRVMAIIDEYNNLHKDKFSVEDLLN